MNETRLGARRWSGPRPTNLPPSTTHSYVAASLEFSQKLFLVVDCLSGFKHRKCRSFWFGCCAVAPNTEHSLLVPWQLPELLWQDLTSLMAMFCPLCINTTNRGCFPRVSKPEIKLQLTMNRTLMYVDFCFDKHGAFLPTSSLF